MSAEPKNHHYVPQFLLRNFSYDANMVNVFDKHEVRQFKANVRNVASENYFYNLNFDDSRFSLEEYFSEIEYPVSLLFKSIAEKNSLEFLSTSDRVIISIFVCLQMNRTRESREKIDSFSRQFEEVMNRRFGIDARELEPEKTADVGYSKDKAGTDNLFLNQIFAATRSAEQIFEKHWMLSRNMSKIPLWISDHPVTLQSVCGSNRSLGIASEGVQINIPLTPILNLSFICKSTVENIKLRGQQYLEEKALLRDSSQKYDMDIVVEKLLSDLFDKEVADLDEGNVIYLNHLQVRFSYRYIYSRIDNFILAKEMVLTSDSFKFGHRISME